MITQIIRGQFFCVTDVKQKPSLFRQCCRFWANFSQCSVDFKPMLADFGPILVKEHRISLAKLTSRLENLPSVPLTEVLASLWGLARLWSCMSASTCFFFQGFEVLDLTEALTLDVCPCPEDNRPENSLIGLISQISRKRFCRNPREFFEQQISGWIFRGIFWWMFWGLLARKKRRGKIHRKIHCQIRIRVWKFRGQNPHCKNLRFKLTYLKSDKALSGINTTGVSKTSLLIFVVLAWFLVLTAKFWQVNDHRNMQELTMN